MQDWSQDREQIAILAALGGEEVIRSRAAERFIEIGAWHPTDKSNVRALYELGWSGVSIEPSPGPMLNMLKEYGNEKRIMLIQAAVGVQGGSIIKMHMTDDAVSTSDQATFDKWKTTAAYHGDLWVPEISLDQITNQFGGFSVWSIDAEGISCDIFHRMVALELRPRVVIVEFDDRMPELASAATNAGYRIVFSNATNVVLSR